jgi:hypothetical protein
MHGIATGEISLRIKSRQHPTLLNRPANPYPAFMRRHESKNNAIARPVFQAVAISKNHQLSFIINHLYGRDPDVLFKQIRFSNPLIH